MTPQELADIEARHAVSARISKVEFWRSGAHREAHDDRGDLIVEVRRLSALLKPATQARCAEMSYEHGQERCMRGVNHRTKCAFASDVGEDVDLAAMHAEDAAERGKP